MVDAQWYVPQSRKRLFVVAKMGGLEAGDAPEDKSPLRPPAVTRFIEANADLRVTPLRLPRPPITQQSLGSVVERLRENDERWWAPERVWRFVRSLSQRNRGRLSLMRNGSSAEWATAYRRTRNGSAVWEIRKDGIAGCLRTAAGGSSKQALVEVNRGEPRVRWMTPLEYARLQGAASFRVPESVSDNQALSGFGDAVCVPALEWIVRECLNPMVDPSERSQAAHAPEIRVSQNGVGHVKD